MEGTVEAMVATEDTTARGPLMLRLRLMLSPPPLLSQDMVTTVTDTDTTLTDTDMLLLTPMDITATTAMDMDTALTDTDMVMAMDITVTTARDLPMLSPDTATTVMGMADIVGATMVMVMDTATDTTVEKFQKFMLIQSD